LPLLLVPAGQPSPFQLHIDLVSYERVDQRHTHAPHGSVRAWKGVGLLSNPDPPRFIFAFLPGTVEEQGNQPSWEYGLYYDLIIDPRDRIPDCSSQCRTNHAPSGDRHGGKDNPVLPLSFSL
jgi:hypothetical protein